MRQVPVLDGAPIGIVGDDYPARHFLHYLSRPRFVFTSAAAACPHL
jgi:hypothetical protein